MRGEKEDDLISRQAAIDAMGKAKWAKERLMELPSAQPTGAPLHDSGTDYAHGFADGYKQGLKDAQPEIIRCKDCDWWTKQEDSVQGRCELMQMYPTGGWYCGNARRRLE